MIMFIFIMIGVKMMKLTKMILDYMIIFIIALTPISIFIIAGILAFHKIDGWGWFIVVGLFIGMNSRISTNTDDNN